MTVYVFRARGTTEPYGRASMLGHVTDQVRRVHPGVVIEDVVHSASISFDNATRDPLAPSGDNCANQIVAWLNQRVAQLGPNDVFVVLGYSLGAVGVTRWLAQHRPGGARCLMVGLIANPSRRAGTTYGLPNGYDSDPVRHTLDARAGIYSTQGTGTVAHHLGSTVPLVEIANPNDVMTSCPKVSPLHSFAGPVMAADLRDPGALIEQLRAGGIERIVASVANVANWANARWWTWVGDLDAFMKHTHTTDYALPMWRGSDGRPVSGIDLLARQANWRIGRALQAAA
ncbi:cutinase family protein [Tsukamurella tyrosinosolvens]|uniref:cutinase family protein n=1 Tax=Tsukamurella tyrosinosolvens TaxID=57704 RepID=UPI000DF6EC26|nr:cutinase family protein [Tsukamurella tyrosinosolvens]RDB46203.1 cutinase family protein [Tsukamurella tyrosinosolvens]